MLEARISERVLPGVVFIPMHWGDYYTSGGAINLLTNDVYDPASKEPEYKACAVAIAAAS
jgi:sulfite reductase (NADPH) flavoprotein alpha-component